MIDEKLTQSGDYVNGKTAHLDTEEQVMPPAKKEDNFYENTFKLGSFLALVVVVVWWAATTTSQLNNISKDFDNYRNEVEAQKAADIYNRDLLISYINGLRGDMAKKGVATPDIPNMKSKEDFKKRK